MKKFLSLFLSFCLIFTLIGATAVFAADTSSDSVEIKFKAGSATMLINGAPTSVEAPYFLNGSTYVPLKVISDAFGAKVSYNKDTKKITIVYNGATIVFKAGDKKYTINNQSAQMPVEPQIKNGSAMVPVRFILEAFGATVGYDGETGQLIIQKGMGADDGSGGTVSNPFTKEKIGDSYYNWSMATPQGMDITDSSNSSTKYFTSQDYAIRISVTKNTDGTTLEDEFSSAKDNAKNYSLVNAAILQDTDGNSYGDVQWKDYSGFNDQIIYVTDKYIYSVTTNIDPSITPQNRSSYLYYASTFRPVFKNDGATQDLSNVVNGTKTYTNKDFKLQCSVPVSFSTYSYSSKDNEIDLYDNNPDTEAFAGLTISIYSKPAMSLSDWAAIDQGNNKIMFDPKNIQVSDVSSVKIAGNDGVTFTTVTKTSDEKTVTDKESYFALGNYVYNLSVNYSSDYENGSDVADSIISSFKADKLDPNVTGQLYFDAQPISLDLTKTLKNKYYHFQVQTLASVDDQSYSSMAMYMESNTQIGFMVYQESFDNVTSSTKAADLKDQIKEAMDKSLDSGYQMNTITFDGMSAVEVTGTYTDTSYFGAGAAVYIDVIFYVRQGKAYSVTLQADTSYMGGAMLDAMAKSMKSIHFDDSIK